MASESFRSVRRYFSAISDAHIKHYEIDGGGINCISELKILDEFMQRLCYDTGKIFRPCEYFHSITGVGASG
jgi:hypothetical protein